jgi:hypothetical protein
VKSAAILLFMLSALAADVIDIGVVTDTEGLAIRYCHDGDQAMVEVTPERPGRNRASGIFLTTNELITLRSPVMSMIPSGTNTAAIRTICAGVTSEVSLVRFVVRRPLPAPRVGRSRSKESIPMPPLPGPLVATLPLAGTNDTYDDFQKRLEKSRTEGRRRSE